MVQTSTQPLSVLPIVQLVREKVTASGMSLRTFAEAKGAPYSTLRYYHDLRLRPLKQPPRPATLRDLALALDVPLGDVEQAALESLAYRQAPGRLESIATREGDPLVAYVDGLVEISDARRAELLEVFRLAVKQARELPG